MGVFEKEFFGGREGRFFRGVFLQAGFPGSGRPHRGEGRFVFWGGFGVGGEAQTINFWGWEKEWGVDNYLLIYKYKL